MKTLTFSDSYTIAENLDVDSIGEIFSRKPLAKRWSKRMRIQLKGKKKPQAQLVFSARCEPCEGLVLRLFPAFR